MDLVGSELVAIGLIVPSHGMGAGPATLDACAGAPMGGREAHCRQLADAVGARFRARAPKMGLARTGIYLVAAISRQATNRVQTRGLRPRVAASRESAAVTGPPLPLDAAVWASTGLATDRRPHVVWAPI